ncbi:MAG: hypothetical protein QM695_11530 [Micropruina sp.]
MIAVAWLVYLVPYFLRRQADPALDEIDPAAPFSATVTIVRPGVSLADADEGAAVVSTPLTRRAALYELAQIDRQAATRRRRVLMVLTLVLFAVSVPGRPGRAGLVDADRAGSPGAGLPGRRAVQRPGDAA